MVPPDFILKGKVDREFKRLNLFLENVNEICDLYRKPPADAVVVGSVDEKTSIQAKERKQLDRPPRPGRDRRQEFKCMVLLENSELTEGQYLASLPRAGPAWAKRDGFGGNHPM